MSKEEMRTRAMKSLFEAEAFINIAKDDKGVVRINRSGTKEELLMMITMAKLQLESDLRKQIGE